jgi:drug/metabolite transporter (DMT)-like permease
MVHWMKIYENGNNNSIWRRNTTLFGYLSAVFSAALFGSISTVAKPAVSDISPILLSSLVYLIAAVVMTPIIQQRRVSSSLRLTITAAVSSILRKKNREILLILLTSIAGAIIAPTLYFFGLKYTSAVHTSILLNGEMVFTVLLAILFFKERLRLQGYIGISLVFVGIVIVSITDKQYFDFQVTTSLTNIILGDFLVLGSTLFWAIDNNISKIITHSGIRATRLIQIKSGIGGTVLIVIVAVLGIPVNLNLAQVPNIILLGSAGFAASLFFFLYSLKRIGTVKTVVIFSTSSVFGVIFASSFLHEQIGIYQIASAIIIILLGIYLINKKGNNNNGS